MEGERINMKTEMVMKMLTMNEKRLLLETLFSQNYAKEIVASEIADLENQASNDLPEERYVNLCKLYDRIV